MPVFRPDDVPTDDNADNPHPVLGVYRNLNFSDAGGLTQFGAFVEFLEPGGQSSIKHWHEAEDEFVYMLSGEAVVHEGGQKNIMRPGDAACFKAGDPAGHCIENQSDKVISYLVVGTRATQEKVTYPDHDRILYLDREAQSRRFTDLAGAEANSPYQVQDDVS